MSLTICYVPWYIGTVPARKVPCDSIHLYSSLSMPANVYVSKNNGPFRHQAHFDSIASARGVLGYQSALFQRRFRLEQYRASSCNIAREFGGITDTPSVSKCTCCGNYCRAFLRRALT